MIFKVIVHNIVLLLLVPIYRLSYVRLGHKYCITYTKLSLKRKKNYNNDVYFHHEHLLRYLSFGHTIVLSLRH